MNLMILGGGKPPAPGQRPGEAAAHVDVRAELEARLARIEACLDALEQALLPAKAAPRGRARKDVQGR